MVVAVVVDVGEKTRRTLGTLRTDRRGVQHLYSGLREELSAGGEALLRPSFRCLSPRRVVSRAVT